MQLVSIGGRVKGACWTLDKRGLTLGRDLCNDIVLDDPIVSRRHCRFVGAGNQVILEDLGCRNPLLVNGLPLRTGVLEVGDEITIGGDRFLLVETARKQVPKLISPSGSETLSMDLRKPVFLDMNGPLDAEQDSPRTIHDLLALQQMSTRLTRCSSRSELTALLRSMLEERFRPLSSWVVLTNEGGEILTLDQEAPSEKEFPLSDIRTALREKRGLLSVTSPDADGASAIAFTIVTPVMAGGKAIGAIAMVTTPPHGVYDEDDLRLLVLIGQSLGPVLWAVDDMEQLRRDNEYLRARAGESLALVGSSKAMSEVRRRMGLAARSDLSVLIIGETGTGKELAARLLHQQSQRKRGPFVAVNCAAIPHELFESFMFGYERGAFTGADRSSPGLLAEAHGGTIFLDEVGDLSLENQARILRSIEYGTYRKPGADSDSRVDVRVVSATNRDLRARVRQGVFREDLFHRLNGFEITLPPLRERSEDIPELAEHFFDMTRQQAKRPVKGFADEAIKLLCTKNWAGNVRELRNCIMRAVSITQSETIQYADIADFFSEPQEREQAGGRSLADLEKAHIARTLETCDGNVSKAARTLGISRSTLYEKIRLYKLG